MTYNLEEIEKYATGDIAQRTNSTVPKVSLQFELTRSQFLKLRTVQVKIDETIVEEVIPPPKVEKKEAATNDTQTEDETTDDATTEDAATEDATTENAASEEATDATETTETSNETTESEEPAEKEYRTYIKPHTFDVKIVEQLNNILLLTDDQLKQAKTRMKALERRDRNKLETDEAKNYYETQIYELRAWLNDDDNTSYFTTEDGETWLAKCSEEEDWLDMEGYNGTKSDFKTRGKMLNK